MSIESELERLKNAKEAIKEAIEEKGVEVSINAKIDEYGAYVAQIQSGGVGVQTKTAQEWESENPVLGVGEFGYDTTNKITKIGDGETAWDELGWFMTETPTIPSFAEATPKQIAKVSESGKARDYFAVGDKKTIELTTGEEITVTILGFNHDDLSDGSGKAGITIGMENCLETTYPMSLGSFNTGGWAKSSMRTQTMDVLFSQLPPEWQKIVKNVDKKTTIGGGTTQIGVSSDKLFLLSVVEVTGDTYAYGKDAGYNEEGEQYEYWRTIKDGTGTGADANDDRIKYLSNGKGNAYYWWLRSADTDRNTAYISVFARGMLRSRGVAGVDGVSFAFCV